MTNYGLQTEVIPLSFTRIRNGSLVSGLTVTVRIVNAQTGATLVSNAPAPEVGSAAVYTYLWTHGLTRDTQVVVTYTVGSDTYSEFIQITSAGLGGRGI